MTRTCEKRAKIFSKETHGIILLRNSQGVALIVALLVLLVLTLIGISAISTTTYETNIAGNERLYNRSFYSADAGVDYFYATNSSYLYAPEKSGTFDSKGKGVDLGGDQFVITWQKLSEETGPPKKVEFLVTSEGISPNLPNAGRVTIETIIEGVDMGSSTTDPQGGDT